MTPGGDRDFGELVTSAGSAGGVAQGRPVDVDGVAAVAEAVEQGVDHLLLAEEVVPVVVCEVRRDDRGASGR